MRKWQNRAHSEATQHIEMPPPFVPLGTALGVWFQRISADPMFYRFLSFVVLFF